MLRPAMSQIIKSNESYYTMVVAIAKRARTIAEDAEENHVLMDEKPVSLAVEEFAEGKYKIEHSYFIDEVEEEET